VVGQSKKPIAPKKKKKGEKEREELRRHLHLINTKMIK
jgi:hypothetical protein